MGRLEDAIHRAVLRLIPLRMPGAVVHHSPNESGLPRHVAMIAGQKAKSLGVLPGFPDLLVIWRGHVFGLEVKSAGGRVSPAQKCVGEAIIANGGHWAVVRSVDDADALLREWRAYGSPYEAGTMGGVG